MAHLNQRPPLKPFTLHAVVLAGGRSTRMQTDKRFLKFQGELLVDRALRHAQESVSAYEGKVFLCGDVPGRESMPDAIAGLGPVSGLRSALNAIEPTHNTWLLVLPVDMPLLNAKILKDLVVTAMIEREDQDYQSICFDGFEMPCLICVNSNTRRKIEDLCRAEIPSSSRSVRTVFDRLGVRKIPLPTCVEKIMVNANSPSDWMRLCEEVLI